MSIYSGFSTRNQEAQYNRLIENLIILLQTRLLFFMKKNPRAEDSIWLQKFNDVYSSMRNLEIHKYLEPKISESCTGIARYFSLDVNEDPLFSEYSLKKVQPFKNTSSIKGIATPRSKMNTMRIRNKSEKVKVKKSAGNVGMSRYYGKIMDNFLGKPVAQSKRSKVAGSMESQDFWLLDDRIRVIESDIEY